jgi:hypothetical protein
MMSRIVKKEIFPCLVTLFLLIKKLINLVEKKKIFLMMKMKMSMMKARKIIIVYMI